MRWARRAERQVASIYGAALAASADEQAAADVTLRVTQEHGASPRAATEAVRLAMEGEPHPAFARLPPAERTALALARLARMDVAQIAELTGSTPDDVKALLGSALRRLARPALVAV